MHIWNSLVDVIVSHPRLRIEYGGTHAPHNETPLYGRRAYWRLYIDDHFVAKVTAPVKVMNPKPATLTKLLKAELKRRINAIQEVVETDHYGKIYIIKRDPCSIRPLVEMIEHEYTHQDGTLAGYKGIDSKKESA